MFCKCLGISRNAQAVVKSPGITEITKAYPEKPDFRNPLNKHTLFQML